MFKEGILNGIRYAASETGLDCGRILIFMPGIGAFKESYIEHVSSFSDLYSAIYLVDLPGQGSVGEWQIGIMVEQLAELIRSIDSPEIERIDLAGHSAGALAAITFLTNYNSWAEERILESTHVIEAEAALENLPSLAGTGFATPLPEAKKVKKLLLYAPPDSFDIVFDRIYSTGLSAGSDKSLRRLLNLVVNRPMLLLRFFRSSRYFRFRLDRSGKPCYFRLVINDHRRFLRYTSGYLTIFEIIRGVSDTERESLLEMIAEKEILVQCGTNDWIVKPCLRRRRRSYQENIRISGSIKVVMHRHLGHMLNRRWRPDINMNLQMVTNPDVIAESRVFIAL